jgi:sugar (pentulose or hexulose) kinase
MRALPHVKEGLWNVSLLVNSSGALFEWYRKHFRRRETPYEELLAELIPSSEDAEIFNGEFLWLLGDPVTGVHPAAISESAALGRAVLCAIGFAVRDALETLEALGFPVREMRVSGGQAKNSRWNQLKADITGRTLTIPEIPDGELAGNAVLAAAALEGAGEAGFQAALESAGNRMIRFREVYEPRQAGAIFWEQRYMLYRKRRKFCTRGG